MIFDMFEMQCPDCKRLVNAKARGKPWLSGCSGCGALLAVIPGVVPGTNEIIISFEVVKVNTKNVGGFSVHGN